VGRSGRPRPDVVAAVIQWGMVLLVEEGGGEWGPSGGKFRRWSQNASDPVQLDFGRAGRLAAMEEVGGGPGGWGCAGRVVRDHKQRGRQPKATGLATEIFNRAVFLGSLILDNMASYPNVVHS
jgi:hypothetical protein